ncbi:hypothetical protein PG993_012795 [Apiospora rasikravindrae]|uniref:NACHT domain-containing protein n=1 Tax=Apiospora rasikravindrae TaxID=990691 RepID=A0ABR1RW82_9PEZI
MDPLSALGVASNILAAIDFAWTLLTEARSIHNSSSGLSGEAEFVDCLIRDVAVLDAGLPALVEANEELHTLLAESKKITALLQNALQAQKSRGGRSKWSSFQSALKHTWGKDQVKDLTSRLGSLQAQVTRHVQMATHKEVTRGVTAISRAIADIESTNIRLEFKRREDFQELQRSLVQAIEEGTRSGRDVATTINGLLEAATRAISESAETVRADQHILNRLYYSNIQTRHRKIEDAHSRTFQWAFEQTDAGHRLKEWLESRDGVFWVYGKPGSGKSTFMKFLCGNRSTPPCLQRWAGDKKPIVAKFFFWIAGSPLQKSQEGLHRSLLFEILRQCPELMPAVRSAISELPDWDQPDVLQYTKNLLLLYQRIVTQEIPVKFCFFIDGLDEFQEKGRGHSDLIKILRQLELSSDIKLCISSRPWTVFVDEFGSNPEWTLKLEDLTRDDIRHYVSDKINEHPQFKTLTHINTEYSQVVDAVVERAQGVFLWVLFVVRTLLEGLIYHDSVSTLYRRLLVFPPDLEPFFQHLIDSVAPIYREQMARYFEIATLAERPLLAMVYSYLDDIDENPTFALLLAQSKISSEQKSLRHDQLRRRLDDRSRGLLELVQCDNLVSSRAPGEFFTYQVDFIHRTVRDFLHQSADVQSLLQHNLGSERFSLTTCHAILAVVKTAPFHHATDIDQLLHLIQTLFFFASKSLAVNPVSEKVLGPILDAAEASYRSTTSSIDEQYEAFLFIGHAARIDFFSYVHKKLTANPNMLRKSRCDPGLAQSWPALYYALRPALYTHHVSTRTVAHLLEAGADPNEVFGGDRTVWADFLFTLHISLKNEWIPHTHMDIIPDKEKSRELVRVLLLHGADLNAYVAVPHTSGLVKAETLINRVLTPDVANQLYQEVQQISDQMKAPWNVKEQERGKR